MKLKVTGLKETIAWLNKQKESIPDKRKEFFERLAEIGIETATLKFSESIYDGDNDVVVKPYTWQGDKLIIEAEGKSVLFIEFGSGITYSSPAHPLAEDYGYDRGGYGYHLGEFGSWRYKGEPGTNGIVIGAGKHKGEVFTAGNPANMAMYQAEQDMRQRIADIAREVFRF